MLDHQETIDRLLRRMPHTTNVRRCKRDALRALRGSILRMERYALDGTGREKKPYTVTEAGYADEDGSAGIGDILLVISYAGRTAEWPG